MEIVLVFQLLPTILILLASVSGIYCNTHLKFTPFSDSGSDDDDEVASASRIHVCTHQFVFMYTRSTHQFM